MTDGFTVQPAERSLPTTKVRSQWSLVGRRFVRHWAAMVGVAILLFLFVVCFGAQWIAPFPKNKVDILNAGLRPSREHWFGTDPAGRDYLTELLYAGQISLKIGVAVAFLSTAIGTLVGAVAGYFGKFTDQLLMRATDVFLMIPSVAILALAIKKFGGSDLTIVLVLAGLLWMTIARVVRGQVLSLREREFVEAARASGATHRRIIVRHLLPNLAGPIIVNSSLAMALAIIAESTLSFLGYGVQPPKSSWGNMLADAQEYFGTTKAFLLYFPGLALLLVVLAINFVGDGLRDALDPLSGKK